MFPPNSIDISLHNVCCSTTLTTLFWEHFTCLECLQKKQHHGAPGKIEKPLLPPDFIEKQRKYFALVDAFELPEEEVSDSELE